MSTPVMSVRDALLIVDVQNDFCPGGALPVGEGDRVVSVLNDWIAVASAAGATVVASRDWHPADHCSFDREGGPWPPHCIQGTPGAAFHPDLNLPDDVHIVDKGVLPDDESYSSLERTDLAAWLRQRNVERLWVGGLAEDYCVAATVVDGCRLGFQVCLIRPATRPVNATAEQSSLEKMRAAGAAIIEERHLEGSPHG